MSVTDHFNFSREKIFRVIRDDLQKSDEKTKNLIDCKGDIIFLWDSKKKRLLTQTTKSRNKELTIFQELHPTEPPLTDIHCIRVNSTITIAALWGPNGVMVMEIPKRWGSCSGFQGGKPIILTRSIALDLQYVLLHNEVRQVRFHPGSPQDNALVVMTSDNIMRVYELPLYNAVEGKMSDPKQIYAWSLTQRSADGKGWNLKGSKVSFLVGLGDAAVDFDFALPIVDDSDVTSTEKEFDDVLWPIIILRGNGDICLLNTSLTCSKKTKFEGPLLMYPPADDNYGVEACSVLVLETTPNVIIVATSSGTLYHSVLLNSDANGNNLNKESNHVLYVLEFVELELGIQLNDDDPSYSCPIILHKDPVSKWKYFTSHNTGLHAVSVLFVWDIENFLEKPLVEDFRCNQTSRVEYLVCTHTNAAPVLPVLGFTIISYANIILALLANGDIVSLPLKITDVLISTPYPPKDFVCDEETPIKKLLQEPFDIHIRNILKRNINQPLIKLDKGVNLSPQESLDLISRTTNLLRQEYFTKFQLVRDEMEQRVITLKALRALHMEELMTLENEKGHLQEVAEKLAEKYEEIKDKQKILNERIENVVNTVLQLEPIESLAEKKMKNELFLVEEKVEYFKKSIATLKKEINYQKYKKREHNLETQKSIHLGGNQIETVKSSLTKTSQEICDLVKVVKHLKKTIKHT